MFRKTSEGRSQKASISTSPQPAVSIFKQGEKMKEKSGEGLCLHHLYSDSIHFATLAFPFQPVGLSVHLG